MLALARLALVYLKIITIFAVLKHYEGSAKLSTIQMMRAIIVSALIDRLIWYSHPCRLAVIAA